MLQYQKIDISEGIDLNETSASKECELCHYSFFKHIGFKFEEHVCNGDIFFIFFKTSLFSSIPSKTQYLFSFFSSMELHSRELHSK